MPTIPGPIPDPVAALVTVLKATAGIAAQVSTRVYGAELPPAIQTQTPIPKAITVGRRGGPPTPEYNLTLMTRVDVNCYAEYPYQAAELSLLVLNRLRNWESALVGACRLISVAEETQAIDLRDPDTNWPYVTQPYLVLSGEVPAG